MEKDKVIVSGVNGFVGHHVARELHNDGAYVVGIGRDKEVDADIYESVDEYHQADLTKDWPETSKAKAIIHLAGLAAVGPSFNNPQLYYEVNTSIVTNLCENYLKQDYRPRIIIVSSGAVYDSNQPMPINENGKTDHSSPYAISKVFNEKQAAFYRSQGLDCVIVRPFNHIGPGQSEGFILPDLYSRLDTLIETNECITAGNLENRRDYTDVRDIAKAYGKLALAPTLMHNTYNICSSVSISGKEILNELEEAMNLKKVNCKIDKSLIRPTDPQEIIGDASRLRDELGWEPKISIHQTVVDFVKSKNK